MNQWHHDINEMHKKFGVHKWVQAELQSDNYDWSRLNKFLQFRINFLKEELAETEDAFNNKDAAEVVDGLIDLCVIAIGTLDAFNVDAQKAWEEVHKANMMKERGIKESRPNPLGLPDLIKPQDWVGPNHDESTGNISDAF
jgi:hypothetical protein